MFVEKACWVSAYPTDYNAIIASHIPALNTLTLSKVPRQHFVSQGPSYAKGTRYIKAVWLRNP
jgi:hypothetical protein